MLNLFLLCNKSIYFGTGDTGELTDIFYPNIEASRRGISESGLQVRFPLEKMKYVFNIFISSLRCRDKARRYCATQHVMPLIFGGEWGVECLNINIEHIEKKKKQNI